MQVLTFNFNKDPFRNILQRILGIILADTFGESGPLISLSDLIILGGTLVPVGGHNIIESAQMSKCIIVGNYFSKIIYSVDFLKYNNAIKLLINNDNLSKII